MRHSPVNLTRRTKSSTTRDILQIAFYDTLGRLLKFLIYCIVGVLISTFARCEHHHVISRISATRPAARFTARAAAPHHWPIVTQSQYLKKITFYEAACVITSLK